MQRHERLLGVLLGTAVGDALGLPYEGMSRRRTRRMLREAPLRHRFLLGRGMVSDDAEQTCMVAHALATSRGDVPAFRNELAHQLRWWFAALPAGIGAGTLRACMRLWLGISPKRSGARSAGNGAAMRAALFGAYSSDVGQLIALTRASTRITHRDERAEQGALAVAYATWIATNDDKQRSAQLIACVRERLEPGELSERLRTAERLASEPTEVLADTLGLERGVSGFVLDTVPVAIHAWARSSRDMRRALTETILLGGDTDTTAAIVGGLVGARTGARGIPEAWRSGLLEWPRSASYMEQLARALAEGTEPPRLPWLGTLPRNALFWLGVYALIARRALPPY